jgi:hypothetical protein
MMQMGSILRTTWYSVKCCAYYWSISRLFPYLAIPQEFLSPPSCWLSFVKDILYSLLCALAREGTRRLEESPPRYRERMECLHISLDAQAVGTTVCPQCGTRSVVHVHRQYPQVFALVGAKRAAITCRCGAVFQAFFNLRCHLHKAIQGGVRNLPIHSRRRGICLRGK